MEAKLVVTRTLLLEDKVVENSKIMKALDISSLHMSDLNTATITIRMDLSALTTACLGAQIHQAKLLLFVVVLQMVASLGHASLQQKFKSHI